MELLELDIQRMPGFEREGFSYRFGKGIHVIYGPNGSGKTTTCKAISLLLWPEEGSAPSPVLLCSRWERGGEFFTIQREGKEIHRPLFLSDLLADTFSKTYTLNLDDLFEHKVGDFAKKIAEEMQGGYDVDSARKKYKVPPKWGQLEARKIAALKYDLERIAKEQAFLIEESLETTLLSQKIQSLPLLEKALQELLWTIEAKGLEEKALKITALIQEFPKEIEDLREEDERELEKILQTPLPKIEQEIDIEQGKKHYQEASFLYSDILHKEAELKSKKEAFETSQAAVEAYSSLLQISTNELLFENSEEMFFAYKSQKRNSLEENINSLQEWILIDKYGGFFRLFLGVSFLIFGSLFFFEKTVFAFLVFGVQITALSVGFIRLLGRKKAIQAQWQASQGLLFPWKAREILRMIAQCKKELQDELSLDVQLKEIKEAREAAFEYKKQERCYREALREKEAVLETFYSHLPPSFRIYSFLEALQAFRESLDYRELFLKKQALLMRVQCLSKDPLSELRKKRSLVRKYKELCSEKTHLEGRIEQVLSHVKDPSLFTSSLELLEKKKEEMIYEITQLKDLQEKQQKSTQSIEKELSMQRFQEKSASLEEELSYFQKKEEMFLSFLLAEFLLEVMEEEFTKEKQPKVLQIANRYFTQFTLGLFSIDTVRREKGKVQFILYEKRLERKASIETLSRGTALQLLLAIRLGYLEAHEKEEIRLPLLIDEFFSHVDDERFFEVAEALVAVSQERQIFLFTCQKSTWHAFQALQEKNNGASIHLIDLNEVQKKTLKNSSTPLYFPQKISIRPPDKGESIDAYALHLGLPPFSKEASFFEQPVSLILHETHEIFQAVKLGKKTVGALADIVQWHPQLFENTPLILEKMDLLKRWLELQKIGRPRKVWREDLEKAVELGIFTEQFLGGVYSCLQNVEGEGELLIAKLKGREVKRLRETSIEELESFLQREGLIDSREVLTREEIRTDLWQRISSSSEALLLYIEKLLTLI